MRTAQRRNEINEAWQQVSGEVFKTPKGTPVTAAMKAENPIRALGWLKQYQMRNNLRYPMAGEQDFNPPIPEAPCPYDGELPPTQETGSMINTLRYGSNISGHGDAPGLEHATADEVRDYKKSIAQPSLTAVN